MILGPQQPNHGMIGLATASQARRPVIKHNRATNPNTKYPQKRKREVDDDEETVQKYLILGKDPQTGFARRRDMTVRFTNLVETSNEQD